MIKLFKYFFKFCCMLIVESFNFKMGNGKSFLIETILTMFEMAQSIIITSAMSLSSNLTSRSVDHDNQARW